MGSTNAKHPSPSLSPATSSSTSKTSPTTRPPPRWPARRSSHHHAPRPRNSRLTPLVTQLRNALEASSDDGWAHLANIGHIITKQRPDFDSHNYGYTKLSDLVTATALLELDRRTGDGKPASSTCAPNATNTKDPNPHLPAD